MGSTVRSSGPPIMLQSGATASVRWRCWPLLDHPQWSWAVPVGILVIGGTARWLGDSWFVALAISAALVAILWQFFLPVTFEVTPLGVRRYALGRVRLFPWQAMRAYQLRPGGVMFYQTPAPARVDNLNALFVPFPDDADEMLLAVRLYLNHATEVPKKT